MASLMETMRANSLLSGANAAFVEEVYEAYLLNPSSVAPEWRAYFDALPPGKVAQDVSHSPVQRAFAALPSARKILKQPM